MNVTPEMRAELEKFLGNVFEKLEIDDDGKALVLDSVTDFMALTEPEIVIRDYVNIKYVGRRPFYDHGKYGRWEKDLVKEVDSTIAAEMLKHPDVFVKAGKDEIPAASVDKEETPEPDEDEEIQELRDQIMGMRRKAEVVDLIKKNTAQGHDITKEMSDPRTTKLAEYKRVALVWLDKYGLP